MLALLSLASKLVGFCNSVQNPRRILATPASSPSASPAHHRGSRLVTWQARLKNKDRPFNVIEILKEEKETHLQLSEYLKSCVDEVKRQRQYLINHIFRNVHPSRQSFEDLS